MGRSSGLGNIIDSVADGGTLRGKGRVSGIPMPFTPTENIGIMSGAIRKSGEGRRDERGSRRGRRFSKVTQFDGSTKLDTGKQPDVNLDFYNRQSTPLYDGRGNVIGFKDGSKGSTEMFDKPIPREEYKGPGPNIGQSPIKPKFDPSKPSAVQETTRVNVQDPTLGGPPEREVPIPKEKDMTPRGPAPFAPDEGDVAKQRFFETMFERAANRKERSGIDKAEMRDRQEARRDEAMMRDSEMGGRRRGRRDFTRRRPERRRSRKERAAFRDRYVSTLGSNFFS